MTNGELSIFISYSHDDYPIATALNNLLQQALSPRLDIFLDKFAISYGGGIKDSILAALERADVLIAVLTGGQPASVLSWPAYEIGWFAAKHNRLRSPHEDPESVIGRAIILCNGNPPLGPAAGTRPVNLGISDENLAAPDTKANQAQFKQTALAHRELYSFIKELEDYLREKPNYRQFLEERQESLNNLVLQFKLEAFRALKHRIRHVSKPSRQLIVRYNRAEFEKAGRLPNETTIASSGGASEVFGPREGDPGLFSKLADCTDNVTRYETTWGEFQSALSSHRYGPYWCGVIEQAVINANRGGATVDSHSIIISSNDYRFRIIATTVTTYFNGDCDVSLYLIEGLQRADRGDPETSTLLKALNLICRFRFAFLERRSEWYWLNFERTAVPLYVVAKELLTELDFLRTEALHADLASPGAWEEFTRSNELREMQQIWNEIDLALRAACNDAITQRNPTATEAELKSRISAQLERIYREVRPFNTLIGMRISEKMAALLKEDNLATAGKDGGRV